MRRTIFVGRTFVLAIAFIVGYLALDKLSFIDALHGIGITPWSPSAGLALALLIIKGVRWAPVVLAAELVSGGTLPPMDVPAAAVFGAALVVAAGYAAAAAILRRIDFEPNLPRASDVALFITVALFSSALVACGFVVTYAIAEIVPWAGLSDAAFHFWIGDAIGIIVVAPPLLIATKPVEAPASEKGRRRWLWIAEIAAQGASVVAALTAVFSASGGVHAFELFYLLFLPLIWISTRHGLAAASWTVLAIQAGLIAGLAIGDQSQPTLRAFQLLMFAVATTGLILGAVVSERRRLSRALSESESRRRTILNTARDGLLTIDAGGLIQSFNPAVERMFSRPAHLLVGRNICELLDGPPDLLTRLKGISSSLGTDATCWQLDAKHYDGSTFPIELSVGRFELLGIEQYTLVMRDITLRRQAEARAREHQAELAHVSRVSLAGEMAAGLAHELTQPLTAIAAYGRGCLRLLQTQAPEPASLQEGVLEVVNQAERAGDVLSRVREFVRGGECKRSFVEVARVIRDAVSLALIEGNKQKVEIRARIDPDLPAILVDHIQIEQVLINLLRNGIDAIDTGNAKRRSMVVAAGRRDAGSIEISVADSGPGVPAELVEKIFDPFVTTKSCGMGMGLSISRSIVEAHGGNLRMVQSGGSGAIFAFDLPIDGPEARGHAG
jgi:two-component system sensor kinase FixL